MKVLYLGATWPQPWITAAGLRTIDLIKALKSLNHSLQFLSIKKPNVYQMQAIKVLDVKHGYVPLNNESEFRSQVSSPDLCIFETSSLEEMFSHMVYKLYPNCKRIVDTQDLHCLRYQRKAALEKSSSLSDIKSLPLDFKQENACREFASILRSHLTILTSSHEKKIIHEIAPQTNIAVLPFLYNNVEIQKHRKNFSGIEKRKNFVWIGNFAHEPNVDALEFTLKFIWPKIYKKTKAEFHIFGAHCPKGERYNSPGVFVKGTMKSLKELAEYKALLAYVRYGAGVKGKVVDSFYYGLPVITTSIGAEGIDPFPGFIEDDPEDFIELACDLYEKDEMFKFQSKAFDLLEEKFSMNFNKKVLENQISSIRDHPLNDIFFSETLRSTVYFSKYIETKNSRVV